MRFRPGPVFWNSRAWTETACECAALAEWCEVRSTSIKPTYAAALLVVLCFASRFAPAAESLSPTNSVESRYEFRRIHDPDGIGKFYMGREIAAVMGHQAADWLERPERDQEEAPDKLISQLQLRPGDIVADIGAGTGYISRRVAEDRKSV